MDDFLSLVQAGDEAPPPASPAASLSLSRSLFGGVPEVVTTPSLSAFAVEWGPSLVLVRDHMAICGGQYGAKRINCFCCALLKDNKGCPSRHEEVKHPYFVTDKAPTTARLYLSYKTAKSNALYAEPYVEVGHMSSRELTGVLARVFGSLAEWKEEALVLNAARDAKQDVSLLRTAVKATNWKRETKLDQDGTEVEVKGDLEMSWDNVKNVMDKLKVDGRDIGSVEGGLAVRVEALQEALEVLQTAMDRGLKSLHLGFGLRLTGVETEAAKLHTFLGELQDQVTKWEGLEFMPQVIKNTFASSQMGEFSTSLKRAFVALTGRVSRMEKRVKERESMSVTGGAKDKSEASIFSITNWLGDAPGNEPGGVGNQSRNKEGADVKEAVGSLSKRVDNLELTVTPGLKAEGENVAVAFMGVRFYSQEDAAAYVEARCNGVFGISAGMITDCYSIFYFLNKEIFETRNKLSVTDLHKVHSLGMPQVDVFHILASVEHGLPDFFDSPASASKVYIDGRQGTKKHRFSNIGTHEIWGPIGADINSVRKRADNVLTRYITTKKLLFGKDLHPELKALLLNMLDVSKGFVEAVFAFLTEEYAALYAHFGDGTLCWDFACSCVEHVFKYEFEAARAVITNPDVGDKEIGSKIFWQSLRTIAIQESFMRVGFKNHSSLSSAYSRFLLKQYQQTALDLSKATKGLEVQQKIIADLKGTVDALDKRIRAAEGTARAANNAVQRMKRND
jgi:hypothetical protein